MEAFLSKLKSTVAEALPGIPLGQDFDVHELRASAGPGRLWKVHAGVQKSNKQAVSIFIFEKKSVEKLPKEDRKLIVEVLKQGANQLTRLRHPKVLSVVRPLEENRECLCFATEPVLGSLADVVLGRAGASSSATAVAAAEDGINGTSPPKAKLDEIEIKYGLLQILDGLSFLHNDAKIVHGGICLNSIVINGNGLWKLCGFEFAIASNNGPGQPGLYTCRPWNGGQCPCAYPDLDYIAPEWVTSSVCDTASDMFSLGAVIHALYNGGKPLMQCDGQLSIYKSRASELKKVKMSSLLSIPETLREFMNLLLNPDSNVRPDANQLSKIPYFESVPVVTLQYIDTLIQRDNLQKSQFFKELPKVLGQLPLRLCLLRVLPALFQECHNHDMIPFVLANTMAVIERASSEEYTHHIFPNLIPLFKISKPIQVPLIFMQNMALLLNKTSTADVKNHVLPMVYRSLELQTDNMQLQELCLGILPNFSNLIDHSAMKNAVIPRIKKLCCETAVLSVRVQCLVCLGKMLDHIDKWVVLDDILPFLPCVPSREAAVLMSILGIYKVAFTHPSLGIGKEMLATKVLPFLLPLCIDGTLNLMQFNAYVSVIKEMFAKVEGEQRSKLEQMRQMEHEQRSLNIGVPSSTYKEDAMTDSFLNSVGLMMGTSGGASLQQTAGGTATKQSLEATSQQPAAGSVATTSAANITKKAQLSLEEKQRLAREQEIQERLSSEPKLTPASSGTAATSGVLRHSQAAASASFGLVQPSQPQPKVKDLTQTLMSSPVPLSYAQSRLPPPAPAAAAPAAGSGGRPLAELANGSTIDMYWANSGSYGTAGGRPPSGSASVQPSGSVWSQQSMTSPGVPQQQQQRQAPIDLSAFDNLLTLPSSQRLKTPAAAQPFPSNPVASTAPSAAPLRLLPPPPQSAQPLGFAAVAGGYGQSPALPAAAMVAGGGGGGGRVSNAPGGFATLAPANSSTGRLNAQDLRDLLG